HRAVFLDRDGTIVDDPPPGFLHEPGKVRLLPGAAAAIRRLNAAGWLVVVATNQSGIGRGLYDAAAYSAGQRRLTERRAAHGAHLAAALCCRHYPESDGGRRTARPYVSGYAERAESRSRSAHVCSSALSATPRARACSWRPISRASAAACTTRRPTARSSAG